MSNLKRTAVFAFAVLSAPNCVCFAEITKHVYFQNTTKTSVDIAWLDGEKATSHIDAIKPNQQVLQRSVPGRIWEIHQNGRPVARYLTDERTKQYVDIARLISWQTPVKLVMQNDSSTPLDIIDDREKALGKLPPGQQFQIDALPGEIFSIRRDGTLVGIYQPTNKPSQTISLKALEEFYKKRVALTFQNRGKVAVDVLLLPGQEGAATRLVTSAMPIGTQASFTAFPGQQWRIRDLNGKTVGDYTVPAEATSLVLDTTKLSPSSGTSTSGPSILD